MAELKLEQFGAYTKSLELFDLVVEDVGRFLRAPECRRLASQHIASADSICSNIEEGYGRSSRKEYAQFLVIARGSAQETKGRYRRLRHWVPKNNVTRGVSLSDEIVGILTSSIKTLRGKSKA